MGAPTIAEVEARLIEVHGAGTFSVAELAELPSAVRRYLTTAIAPGTPRGLWARLRMRGQIKIGRWLPFRAREVLAPHRGFVWPARVGGVIVGSDRYVDGVGVMAWKLFGVVGVARAQGPDVSRSAAGRGGAEAIWVPTSLLPRYGVAWAVDGADIVARYHLDDTPLEVRLTLDDEARPRAIAFDRWGDPDQSGTWGWHPAGGEFSAFTTFDGVSIPSVGRFGWFYGTDRWAEGEFFRYRITACALEDGRAR